MHSAGDGVRSCRFQLRDMEYRMDSAHGVWKPECEGMSSDLRDNCEWSEELLRKFL